MTARGLIALVLVTWLVPSLPAAAAERNHGRFLDDDGHPAEQALELLADLGVVQGCDPPADTRICPDSSLTRAQMAKMVVILGQSEGTIGPFPSERLDRFVDDDEVWGGSAERLIDLIAFEGIVHGCDPPSNRRFCPNDHLTRAQTAKIVVNALELSAPDGFVSPWKDADGRWYEEAARVAAFHGLWDASAGRFQGEDTITRAEFAEVLVRAVGEDRCTNDPFTATRLAGLETDYPAARFTAYVYDAATGCAYWMNANNRQETASVFKVMVMAGTLLEAQNAGRAPTSWEWSRLEPMITESADQPVRDLWSHFGGAPWFQGQADIFGLTETDVVGDYWEGPWGATHTSARAQADLLRQVLLGDWGPLEAGGQGHAWELMTSGVDSQTWGITAGVPEEWIVAQKNGFFDDTTNSVGVVRGPEGQEYVVVILTTGWGAWEDGVPAVERISRWVAQTVSA